jgi:hypothetical protein
MNIIQRVKGMLLNPKAEWEVIKEEKLSMMDVFLKYVLILALIPAAAAFVGWTLIGYNVLFISVKGVDMGIKQAIIAYVTSCLAFFISTLVINAIAPGFKSDKNIDRSAQLIAYTFTPFLVAGIFNIIPNLSILAGLLGLYGLYMLYLGIPKLKSTPEDQVLPYFLVACLVILVSKCCFTICY